MEKRVLVIPNWGQMTEQVNGMPAEDALKKYSPGKLLAECQTLIQNDLTGTLIIDIPEHLRKKFRHGQPVHALILEGK